MRINILDNYTELSKRVADIVESQVKGPSLSKLALPTGSTPLGLYEELVKRELDWSSVMTFNLDEYIINPNHPMSYHTFMRKNLFDKTNIYPSHCHFPDRNTQWYEDKIAGTMGGGTGSGPGTPTAGSGGTNTGGGGGAGECTRGASGAGGSGIVIVKEPAISIPKTAPGVWQMNTVYEYVKDGNWV